MNALVALFHLKMFALPHAEMDRDQELRLVMTAIHNLETVVATPAQLKLVTNVLITSQMQILVKINAVTVRTSLLLQTIVMTKILMLVTAAVILAKLRLDMTALEVITLLKTLVLRNAMVKIEVILVATMVILMIMMAVVTHAYSIADMNVFVEHPVLEVLATKYAVMVRTLETTNVMIKIRFQEMVAQ